MLVEEIEKAWAARAKSAPFYPTPTFVGDALVWGTGIEIALALRDFPKPAEKRACAFRPAALLAAAFRRPIGGRASAHLRCALYKRSKGDDLGALVHLALMGLPRLGPLDPATRRLFAADRLLHAGVTPETIFKALDLPAPSDETIRKYSPNQPRVPAGNGRLSGQWTSEDGAQQETMSPQGQTSVPDASVRSPEPAGRPSVAAAATLAVPARAGLAEAGSFFARNIALRILARLAQIALGAAEPVLLFGMLLVPAPSKLPIAEGQVPGRTDLKYEWLQDEGVLLLHRLINGQWVTVAEGHMDLQGVFHDRAGKPFARVANGVLIMDVEAASQAEEDENKQERDTAAGAAAAIARTKPSAISRTKEEPKLCPDPTPESNKGWSKNSIEYQSKVTRLPPGLAVKFNGVKFDGCVEEKKGLLLQATAGRGNFIAEDGNWFDWFTGGDSLERQIDRSEIAAEAGDRKVEWHVQSKGVTKLIKRYVSEHNYFRIEVIYDPIGTPP
ncbi:MAG TPA: Tox-REase-5 domain-containing protein [Roseiarcus sp.]|nr:Tox-REase-5 domain-containing protein [Roseiarcus sp.]